VKDMENICIKLKIQFSKVELNWSFSFPVSTSYCSHGIFPPKES